MLPYGRQVIEQDDIDAVVEVLKSDFLTTGPQISLFEESFRSYVGAPYATACANGTVALHLASLALELAASDQVIVPAISFVATANGPRYCGADIIFADVDPDTGLVTPETIKAAVAVADPRRLKAIFVVHLAGNTVELAAIARIARSMGAALVEDACHAIGTEYETDDRRKGRIGDCAYSDFATFSLHPVKTITTGEGGLITTGSAEFNNRMRLLRNHGLVRDPSKWVDRSLGRDPQDDTPNQWVYELQVLGHNFRISDIQAALGRTQLAKMPRFAAKRRALVARYRELLAPLAPHIRAVPSCPQSDPVLHLMAVLIDFPAIALTRAQVIKELAAAGIGTQVHYIPINRQPYYRSLGSPSVLPGADAYYERCLSLPLFPTMALSDVDCVVSELAKFVKVARIAE